MKFLNFLWCDFNSLGWGEDPDDGCYYVFEKKTLQRENLKGEDCVFIFMYEDKDEKSFIGCEAILEEFQTKLRASPESDYLTSLRARPVSDTWIEGKFSDLDANSFRILGQPYGGDGK